MSRGRPGTLRACVSARGGPGAQAIRRGLPTYADVIRAFGGHAERVTDPLEIVPAIPRGIQSVQDGTATLLEFITAQERHISSFP